MENIKKITELYDKDEKELGRQLFNGLEYEECMEFLTKNRLTETKVKRFLNYYPDSTIQELTKARYELDYPVRLILE